MKERKHFPQNEEDNGGPYIQVQMPNGQWVFQHRFIMEEYLKRKIPLGAVVHHRDRRRTNNEISNLLLMRSQDEHLALHRAMNENNRRLVEALEQQSFEFMKRLRAGLAIDECLNLPDPSKPAQNKKRSNFASKVIVRKKIS